MIDMNDTIIPKSDQLNSDTLLAGPRTITITKVSKMKEPDQPVAVYFNGDNGKPYKPGKSMRRVMVKIWGPDAIAYIGHSMTLYCDDKVMFGGVAVGGIRISHMTGITQKVSMALTDKKGSKKPFVVLPLVMNPDGTSKTTTDKSDKADKAIARTAEMVAEIAALAEVPDLMTWTSDEKVKTDRAWMTKNRPELAKEIDEAVAKALARLEAADEGTDEPDGDLGQTTTSTNATGSTGESPFDTEKE